MGETEYKVVGHGDRPRRIWPLLLIAAIVAIYFNQMLLLKKVPLLSDIKSYYYPAWTYFSAAVKTGSIPLWCPGIYCGFPLFADSEMALFYPLNLLLFRLPTTMGFNYSLIIHYLLGGWFTYAFCRRLHLSRSASLFAAIPFVLGGFFISHMVHPNVVATAAWMPLFLYCLERALAERRRSFFVAAGGVLGLQFLSGFLMIPLMEVVIALFYIFFYEKEPDESRGSLVKFGLGGLGLAVLIAAGIGMVQNLPSYYLVQNSYRSGGLTNQVSNMGNLPAIQLAGLIFPRAFGRGVSMGSYVGAWTFEETYGYIGILPFLFASLALFRPRRWHTVFFGVLAVVSLLLSLGNQGLLWPLLRIVPGFNVLKGSSRFLLPMNLGVAIMAGIGFDLWRKGGVTDKIRKSIGHTWVIIFAIIGGLLLAAALLYHFNPLHFQDFMAAVARPFMTGIKSTPHQVLQALDNYFLTPRMEFLFPLLALALFLFLLRRNGKGIYPGQGKILLALVVVVADVLIFSSFIFGFVPRSKVDYSPPVTEILQDQADDGRVAMLKEPGVSRGEYPLCSNQLLPYSLNDPFGFSTIPPARLDRFLAAQDRTPTIEGFQLLGASLLFSNLARVGGLPYDLSSPLVTVTGVQARGYVYPDIIGEQLRIILDGTIMQRETSGTIYIDISSNGPDGTNALATLRLDKEYGEDCSLEVLSGHSTAFIHTVSFRSAGYGQARHALEIRIPVDRIYDTDQIDLMSVSEELDGTRFLGLDAVDRRGNGLPLTELPIAYLDRDYVVYDTPDPKPTAFYAWSPSYADTWREAVDQGGRDGSEEGKVVLLGSEIDADTRAQIEDVQAPPEEARISDVTEGRDRISLHSSNNRDSILVLAVDYMPGWVATMDGMDTPIFSADGFYTGIFLPGGEHDIEFAYYQPGLGIGGAISSLGVILFGVLLFLFLHKESAAIKAKRASEDSEAPGPDSGGISAFFPCYNDSATVAKVVEKAIQVLSGLTDDFEIIIVDDGSVDESPRIAEELSARHPEVRVVHHEKNLGYGAALKTGIKSTTKKWIFYTDSDGQYDIDDLLKLHSLSGRADIINGYKAGRHDPWYRIILGSTYSFLIHRLFSMPLRDVDCDFRLMRGDLARGLDLRSDGGAICVEMVKGLQAAGATFIEVPVEHHERESGKSQFFKPKNLVVMIGELLALWWKMVIGRESWFAGRK